MRTLKIFLRGFKKDRHLNLLNISSMAIGLAAAIIVIGYVYQEFNYDSGYENSDRVYHVLTQNDKNEISGGVTYGPMAQSLKSDFPEISDATRASFYWGYLAFTAGDNMFNENSIIFADPNFFTLFSFPLIDGDAAKCLEAPNSIVLSESAAKKYFGETDVIGKQIKIGEDRLFNVEGVFKDFAKNSNFRGDIILPLEIISQLTQVWIEPSWNYPTDIHTFILTENQIDEEIISTKISDYLTTHVEENPEKLLLQPLKNIHTELSTGWGLVSPINKSYLLLLTGVAFLILVMSAVNFLLLYIGMASKRALNTGVKKVFGASRAYLFRNHLSEVFSFITISTIISIVIVILYNSILAAKISFLPALERFDGTLLLILLGTGTGFAILTSVFPAVFASCQKAPEIYKKDEQSLRKQPRIVNILVTGQFAISVALIAITTLFYKQIDFLEKHNPGFAREELLTIPLNMHLGSGIYNENLDVFCDELKKQSGIKDVTLAFSSPSDIQTSADNFRIDGMPEGENVNMQWNSVYYDYFETLGINIVDGRGFSREFQGDAVDYDNGGKCSFVINQTAAKESGIENPIGKILHGYEEGVIIGIVEDFNFKSLHSEITPMCFNINPVYFNEIIVRTNSGVLAVPDQIKSVWNKFVPEYPFEFKYINDQLNEMYESESRLTASLNVFAGIGILIACMGLLALSILSMQKRTKEIGIRKVNGAKVSEILSMLNKDFVKWVVIAFTIATPIAYFAMNKWLENFAYKTNLSWWIFALAGLLALGIALLTVSWQSWRAATRNPVEALRYE
ncbi:MAG: ABC transporter permease [Bacteroidales bacterium]|nr:ABC transporter permease [Bacteroidales bacterium]